MFGRVTICIHKTRRVATQITRSTIPDLGEKGIDGDDARICIAMAIHDTR